MCLLKLLLWNTIEFKKGGKDFIAKIEFTRPFLGFFFTTFSSPRAWKESLRVRFKVSCWNFFTPLSPLTLNFDSPPLDAPLDLFTETFYFGRRDVIETRLSEIEDSNFLNRLRDHDKEYRGKACIGVGWETFDTNTLLEIAQVSVLSQINRSNGHSFLFVFFLFFFCFFFFSK